MLLGPLYDDVCVYVSADTVWSCTAKSSGDYTHSRTLSRRCERP